MDKVDEYAADTPAGFTFIPFGMGLLCEFGSSAAAHSVLFNRMRPYETTLPRQHKHPSGASQK
jgi:hypothetical protein